LREEQSRRSVVECGLRLSAQKCSWGHELNRSGEAAHIAIGEFLIALVSSNPYLQFRFHDTVSVILQETPDLRYLCFEKANLQLQPYIQLRLLFD
jgi:hypothetical protein